MAIGLAAAAPCVALPWCLGGPERGRPLGQRYWVKANLWIAILSFVGNYFWTHYFYALLGARYTFPSWQLNGVRGAAGPPPPPPPPPRGALPPRWAGRVCRPGLWMRHVAWQHGLHALCAPHHRGTRDRRLRPRQRLRWRRLPRRGRAQA